MKTKIACIGDSITYGYPFYQKNSWVSLASEATGFNMLNMGVNGDTTGNMAYRFSRDVLNINPTHVIIMGGSNDAILGEKLERVQNNIQTMIRKAQAKNIIPFIGLPIPTEDEYVESNLRCYRQWMIQYAEANQLKYINFAPIMMDPINNCIIDEFYAGGLHPSIEGYQAMADIVQKFLLKNIIEK